MAIDSVMSRDTSRGFRALGLGGLPEWLLLNGQIRGLFQMIDRMRIRILRYTGVAVEWVLNIDSKEF